MKRILFTVLLATGLAGVVLAAGSDKEERENPNTSAEKQIKADTGLAVSTSGAAGGQWRTGVLTREFQQAAFLQGSTRKSLFFSPDNAHLRARFEVVAPRELAGKVIRRLGRKYKGYQVAQVLRFDDGAAMYFITLRKGQEEVLVAYAENKITD